MVAGTGRQAPVQLDLKCLEIIPDNPSVNSKLYSMQQQQQAVHDKVLELVEIDPGLGNCKVLDIYADLARRRI